eukprot:scaffold528_cov165-Amphora_coffeaeformis.AAC.18
MTTLPMLGVQRSCSSWRQLPHRGLDVVLDILLPSNTNTNTKNRTHHHTPYRYFVGTRNYGNESATTGDAAADGIQHNQETSRAATVPPPSFDTRTINRIMIQTMAILQRGTCCGSQCRACPYGWTNVTTVVSRGTTNKPEAPRRPALVSLGDVPAKEKLLQKLQQGDGEARQRVLENASRRWPENN